MKRTLLLVLLALTPLTGYLEWGRGYHQFLWESELDIIRKLLSDPLSVLHPFVLLPMAGQLLLLIAAFRPGSPRWLIWLGIGSIGLLLYFMAIIGLLSLNMRILLSTLPFIAASVLAFRELRKE
nr:hypothetical protein [uncultured Arsenicibacter sp.]